MSDRTGRALGSLSPVIYFENKDRYVILPPMEKGSEVNYARMAYEQKYKDLGWEWREAGTLGEVDALQQRLVEQQIRRNQHMAEVNSRARESSYKAVGDNLRSRMTSSATTPFDREAIAAYLQLREEKRDKYRAALEHRNYFIYAREMDSSRKPEDQMPTLEGQFERR